LAIANQRAATTTQGATTPIRLDTTQDTTTSQHETATRLEAPYGSMTQGELETWLQQQAKAVKADDAANPTYLWDERVWAIAHDEARQKRFRDRFSCCPLESICMWLLRRWR